MTDPVKEFWNRQATEHGMSDLATAPDHYYRELEIKRILPLIGNNSNVIDVGCGNGYSTMIFAREWRTSNFLGVDYSPEMIAHTQGHKIPNLTFEVGNVLQLRAMSRKFDTAISERCLINLANWQEQQHAILELKSILRPGGRLILVENTQEGLDNLNKLRQSVGLQKIQVRWHNAYLPQRELIAFLHQHFNVLNVENIGNLYYILSRVVYAKLAQMEGKEPVYGHPINKIASELPSLSGYHYSPNFMYVLRSV